MGFRLASAQLSPQFFFEDRSEFSQQTSTIAPKGAAMLTGERRGIERCQSLQNHGGLGRVSEVVHRLPHCFAGRRNLQLSDGNRFRTGLSEEVVAKQSAGCFVEQHATVPAVWNLRRINPLPRLLTG